MCDVFGDSGANLMVGEVFFFVIYKAIYYLSTALTSQ